MTPLWLVCASKNRCNLLRVDFKLNWKQRGEKGQNHQIAARFHLQVRRANIYPWTVSRHLLHARHCSAGKHRIKLFLCCARRLGERPSVVYSSKSVLSSQLNRELEADFQLSENAHLAIWRSIHSISVFVHSEQQRPRYRKCIRIHRAGKPSLKFL